ncbi:MAG: DUF1836 domain-containing protein [Clostridia bacterium]|nr:DUF1836 domain-containing protein [Clostridia bacterium]
MNICEVEELVREAVRDADLRPEEIPAIDLYLDQITSLVADKKHEGSARFEDRVLTKTMINNYSKDGLLSPIKGKKYSKEHILQMLAVYELKNTLSIGEIKRVLQNVYKSEDYSGKWLEGTYNRYLDIKEYERSEAWSLLRVLIEKNDLDVEKENDFFTLLLAMASMSSYLKNAVQLLLESHYPDPDAEKNRAEQEKKEEAKRVKAEQKSAKVKEQKAQKEASPQNGEEAPA